MRLLASIALSIFVSFNALAAEKLISTGEGFDKEGKTKVFDYERFQDVQGNKTLDRAVYKGTDGKVLVEEKMETVDGKLVRYDIDQKQLKQTAWIEADKENVTFNLKKFRKRNYPQTTSLPDNFIVGLQIVPTVRKNWDLFNNGQEMKIKLGVWHRQEAIGFTLKRDSQSDSEMVVKMNPSSMFIRAVVDPIFFTFDKKTKLLKSYKGRLTPKEKRGGSHYDQDGMVTYKVVGSAAPAPAKKKAKKTKKSKKK